MRLSIFLFTAQQKKQTIFKPTTYGDDKAFHLRHNPKKGDKMIKTM